jgi:hypothetical protein
VGENFYRSRRAINRPQTGRKRREKEREKYTKIVGYRVCTENAKVWERISEEI